MKRGIVWPFLLMLWATHACSFATITERFDAIRSDPNALYAFLKEMPKGGELHYHLWGGAYPETLLAVAAHGSYCIDPSTFIISPKVNETCKNGVEAKTLLSQPAQYNEVIRAWSMKDFYPMSESGHDHFFATFPKIAAIMEDTIPFFAEILRRAAQQQEYYLEIMIMPDGGRSAKISSIKPSYDNWVQWKNQLLNDKAFISQIDATVNTADTMLPAVHRYLHCAKNPNEKACNMTVRFQYHIIRDQPLDAFFAQALHAFAAVSRSKSMVAINLVAPEDGRYALQDYSQQMKMIAFLHTLYPHVHIALHAGELVLGQVPTQSLQFHIHEAIDIAHAERIGHGVDIAYEENAEDLLKNMAEQSIPVEINLVSNEKILNLKGKSHPLLYYLNHGVPVVFSTDDEGVLRTDLTAQYVKAVLEHDLNYLQLKEINRNSLSYSFLPGKSLWRNPKTATRVDDCQDLESKSCMAFIAEHPKAALQHQLELALQRFEE